MSAILLDQARTIARVTRDEVAARPSAPGCIHTPEWLEAETRKVLHRFKLLETNSFRSKKWFEYKSAEEERERRLERWAPYQAINELLLPCDPTYTGNRGGVALSTTADFWTLTSPAAGQVRIIEVLFGGEATASAVNRISVQRSTSGTTATNQTPELMSTRSPAAASTFATTWSAQPTLSGNPLLQFGLNAFGGGFQWVALPGEEPFLVNGEKMSARSASGTSTFTGHVIWDEL